MKNLRLLLPSLLLAALTSTGCFLVSGQFLVQLDLDTVTVTSPLSINGVVVDLHENDTYNDHKDNIKDIADFALLGNVHNNSSSALSLEVYMVPNGTSAAMSLTAIQSTGIKIWGPLVVPGNGDVTIGWDQSAALFTSAGKTALLSEIKGDGAFALYAVGASPNFTYSNGVVVAVLSAGT
jgi:hypothetical protein